MCLGGLIRFKARRRQCLRRMPWIGRHVSGTFLPLRHSPFIVPWSQKFSPAACLSPCCLYAPAACLKGLGLLGPPSAAEGWFGCLTFVGKSTDKLLPGISCQWWIPTDPQLYRNRTREAKASRWSTFYPAGEECEEAIAAVAGESRGIWNGKKKTNCFFIVSVLRLFWFPISDVDGANMSGEMRYKIWNGRGKKILSSSPFFGNSDFRCRLNRTIEPIGCDSQPALCYTICYGMVADCPTGRI